MERELKCKARKRMRYFAIREQTSSSWAPGWNIFKIPTTLLVRRMPCRKWRGTPQQPSRARSGCRFNSRLIFQLNFHLSSNLKRRHAPTANFMNIFCVIFESIFGWKLKWKFDWKLKRLLNRHPGNQISCCLVSIHILCNILQTIDSSWHWGCYSLEG